MSFFNEIDYLNKFEEEKDKKIIFTMCNPPFFSEKEDKKKWINTQ